MRAKLPASLVVQGHPDFAVSSAIIPDLEQRAGGQGRLAQEVPALLREVVDDVIQTPRTGRRSYDELEKTEKTYIGTRVEIMLRALLSPSKWAAADMINTALHAPRTVVVGRWQLHPHP